MRGGEFPARVTALGARARPLARVAVIVMLALLLGACVGNIHMSFLDAQGPVAAAERWHFYWVLGIMGVLVAGPIFLVMPFLVWRYRYGNNKARYTPKWKYSGFIEIVTWAGPIIIVCILGYLVWTGAHQLDPYKPLASNKPALKMQVIGYDWKWLFIYPDQGIATVGSMALPVGRPVSMRLTSATVMQSFFIPSLGSQIYAMGGMVTRLNLEAGKPGRFLGENTMYNGNGFHQQKFTAVAMTPDQFKAWVRNVKATGVPLDAQVFKAIARRDTHAQLLADLPPGASHDGTVYLTGVSPKLFAKIVKATMHGTPAGLAYGTAQPGPDTAAASASRSLGGVGLEQPGHGLAPHMSSFRGRLRLYRRRNPEPSDFDRATGMRKAKDAGFRVPAAKSAAGPGMTMWFVEPPRESGKGAAGPGMTMRFAEPPRESGKGAVGPGMTK